ncbi:MAG TPA: hypothetical protein VFU22_29730, partial [Roseiflexaceae bacterium]|nr:hypothetical protein [Roseiflexaceae bacterium]
MHSLVDISSDTVPFRYPLGGARLEGWTGVDHTDDGAALRLPGDTSFRLPDGSRGWYKHGLRIEHDGNADWRDFYGLRFEVYLEAESAIQLEATVTSAQPESVTASVTIAGAGWHTVTLPWSAFAFEQARTAFLKFVKELRLHTASTTGGAERVLLRNVVAVRGEVLALVCDVRGKTAASGESVTYHVTLGNCTDEPQAVTLIVERYGWEAMTATVEPRQVLLAPVEQQHVTLRVQIPIQVPPGGHERQLLRAIPNGDGSRAATLECVTAAAVPHPYLLHTPARWQEVREKVRDYTWAKQEQDTFVARADAWQVPAIAQPPDNDPNDTFGPFLFQTVVENDLMACGVAWQLTRDRGFAEKIALFLRRLSDPQHGYPTTLRGCSQHLVQEGHFFQHIAMAYDMTLDAGVFSPADQEQIAHTFRLYIETIDQASRTGAINNWNVSEIVGAFYCALVLGDLATAERFFRGPAGILDQLAKGTMDDGWWYECSISYNMWCAAEFCQVALAYEPWGVNFRDMRVPASYSPDVSLSAPDGRVELSGGKTDLVDLNALRRPFGMSKEIWGPSRRPYREIRDLWN